MPSDGAVNSSVYFKIKKFLFTKCINLIFLRLFIRIPMCNIHNVILTALYVAVFAVQSATLSTVCKIADWEVSKKGKLLISP